MFHNCQKPKCGRKFPWGITSQDGVCAPCRWPAQWSAKDEAVYQRNLSLATHRSTSSDATVKAESV